MLALIPAQGPGGTCPIVPSGGVWAAARRPESSNGTWAFLSFVMVVLYTRDLFAWSLPFVHPVAKFNAAFLVCPRFSKWQQEGPSKFLKS